MVKSVVMVLTSGLHLALGSSNSGLFLSSSSSCAETVSSYECGFEPCGTAHLPFCMKFFLLAILFLVFDVEVAFLFPGLYMSSLFLSFTLVLFFGLLYEYAYGGLS